MSFASEVMADGPALYYRFEDFATLGNDSSGNADHASVSQAVHVDAVTVHGGAKAVQNPRLTTPYASGSPVITSTLTEFTVEFWFRTTGTSTYGLVGITDAGNFADASSGLYRLYMTSGKVNFDGFHQTGRMFTLATSTTYSDGQPHHVVAVWGLPDAGGTQRSARLYIDNVLIGSTTTGAYTQLRTPTSVPFYIGHMGGLYGYPGIIDEVAVYDHILTAGRVSAHYNATGNSLTLSAGLPRLESDLTLLARPPVEAALTAALPALDGNLTADLALADAQVALTATLPALEADVDLFLPMQPEVAITATLPGLEADFTVYTELPPLPVTMLMRILDPDLRRGPTSVTVTLSGAIPGDLVEFSIGTGPVLTTVLADGSGGITAASVPVPPMAAGTYTLNARSANETVERFAAAQFTLALGPAQPHMVAPDADPVEIPEALNPDGSRNWVLQDLMPGGLGSWVLPRNPVGATHPVATRVLSPHATTAVAGKHHVFEAATRVHEWTLTGLLFTQEEHTKLEAYGALNRRFYLIDDLNRAWPVALTKVEVTPRLRTRFHLPGQADQMSDWVAEYTVTAITYGNTWLVPQ